MLFVFVMPKIGVHSTQRTERCLITLAHVVPAFPSKAVESVKSHPKKTSVHKDVKAPEKVEKKADAPVRKPVPKAVKKTVQKTIRMEKTPSPVKPAAESQTVAKQKTVSAVPAVKPPQPLKTTKPLPAVPAPQSSERYFSEHLSQIARMLQEYLYYPRMARKRHIEGEVLAVFTLEKDGTIHDIAVKKHARKILDRAAVQTIASLSGRMPHPEQALTLEVPIRFVLK